MDKPLSFFLANVVKNGAITLDQAHTFNQLASPHLQFEAVLALKRAHTISPCNDVVSEPKLKTSFMANTRWIEIGVLSVAIPMVHAFWPHSPQFKKSLHLLTAAPEAIFVTGPSRAHLAKKPLFQPKTENEALSHFMNEPLQHMSLRPIAHLNEQDAIDAERAALDAMPITSRR